VPQPHQGRRRLASRLRRDWASYAATVSRCLDTGQILGAENLRHQAIFVNHAPGAIAPLDPELIRIRDAVGELP
jgi:hypothetical protein